MVAGSVRAFRPARVFLRALFAFACFLLAFTATERVARAVVARGVVTDALGRPIAAARVQLVQGAKVMAIGIAGPDGVYEVRFAGRGRFILLTSAARFYPGIGQEFYGGPADVVTQNVVLETLSLHEEVTVTATGVPTPVAQTSAAVTLIPERQLETRAGIVDLMRLSPGVAVVQTGQWGGATSLFVRGGNSDANKVLIDGIPAEAVGGRFDFGTLSTTALGASAPSSAAIEIYRGADSAVYGSDAAASVVAFGTARGSGVRPVLHYSGDAGTLHTYRNEVTVGGARRKFDALAGFSRFDTSNALKLDEYHASTAAANLGYAAGPGTTVRFTLRSGISAAGLPNAHDFYGVSAAGKQSDQNLYSGVTVEDTRNGGWHNLVRYGVARTREQARTFYPAGQYVAEGGAYFGNTVTIRGANGYTATGRAALAYPGVYPQRDDLVSNRDELYYGTDTTFAHRIRALFGFRYEKERGSFVYPTYGEDQRIRRTNFEYTAEIAGQVKNRLFVSGGGALEKNHLYGVAGTPRFGVVYVPVRPAARWLHGTRVRANAATGVQEPSLAVEFSSLYLQLALAGNTTAIQQYGVRPIRALRSRTLEFGVDQSIRGEKLVLKLGYFHNQFSHQIEYVGAGTLKRYFGITGTIPNFYGADVGSLAFRAQGIETEVDWRPSARWTLRGGWTYLDAVVEQSFSSDEIAVQGGYASQNPNIPGIAIGESPFVGARPFRRPPHTGFFTVEYLGNRFTAGMTGALASRADDSTFLDYSDLAGTNSLILPNRNLDFGYAKLDANLTYALRPRVKLFTQMDNLLNQQHIGPIGYPGLPFTIRAGLKVRVGGD
ncbi:MAG: TonB-dependent receptor plug domain-containing protein [Acidobacteriota bacterium]|nr:TonB-dependent receptor plug domain-containing protein [Acidobacteriota bacterium]